MRRAGSCPLVRPVRHEPTGIYEFLLMYIVGNRLFNAKLDRSTSGARGAEHTPWAVLRGQLAVAGEPDSGSLTSSGLEKKCKRS
jgi:hypothetical protein